MRGRGPSLRQMSTQYTQDVVAAAAVTGFLSENMTFVTSYSLGVLHTPAIAAHYQEARASLYGLEQQGTDPPLAGTDFALNRSSPLPPQAFN